jgi:hypothetical protein
MTQPDDDDFTDEDEHFLPDRPELGFDIYDQQGQGSTEDALAELLDAVKRGELLRPHGVDRPGGQARQRERVEKIPIPDAEISRMDAVFIPCRSAHAEPGWVDVVTITQIGRRAVEAAFPGCELKWLECGSSAGWREASLHLPSFVLLHIFGRLPDDVAALLAGLIDFKESDDSGYGLDQYAYACARLAELHGCRAAVRFARRVDGRQFLMIKRAPHD